MPTQHYAPGNEAWGRCQRCAHRYLLKDLVFDGYMPGLRVCIDCYDARHPQEFLQDVTDPQTLWKPSPEYGPLGPVLTLTSEINSELLIWTPAHPRGGPRIDHYTLYRSASYDGGLTFQPFVQIFTAPVVYYDALILDGPTFGASNTGSPSTGVDNYGIVSQPSSYLDTTISPGLAYQYYVEAWLDPTNSRGVPSNIVDVASVLTVEYLTSRPYPYDFTDAMKVAFSQQKSDYASPTDAMKVSWAFEAGNVVSLLITYSNYAPEPLKTAFAFESGTVQTLLITYSNYAPEPLKTGFSFQSGTVVTELITYSNYAPEPLKTGFSFISGTVV